MRLTLIVCLISIGYASAQYSDSYENNNVNPYPRSQYDSGESYSPPTRSAQSYPTRSNSPSPYSKPKPKIIAKLTPEEEEEAKAAEEEKKPSELELLLANSKFSCGGYKDGYYADTSTGCQVFHYCVQNAKHSWMCPKGTVFHQVHLNCVPAAQDICSQSEKYHIVNEYLHKPIETSLRPNQTVRYHQRYYPDEFLGDPLAPPNTGNSIQQYPPPSSSRASSNSNYDSNSYNSNAYNSYEDETPISYRPAARPNNKPSYTNYPQSYPAQPKPVASARPKASGYSSGGNYPVSLISSPQPSRKPASSSYNSDSYNDGSYRSSSSIYSQPATPAVRSKPAGYQPYSAAASAPSYKPVNSAKPYNSYPSSVPQSRPSAGYDNSKPYNDYSGVTYEEDY